MAIELPAKKTEVIRDFTQMNTLIYGLPKIGKTTFASTINGGEGLLFLATEQGHKNLSVYKVDITRWEDFLEVGQLLVKGGHAFKTLVVDTVDLAWRMCQIHVCKKYGIDHQSDLAYGKGSDIIKSNWLGFWNRINQLGFPLVFISHAREREIKTKNQSITYMDCTLPSTASAIVCGMVDFIFYVYSKEDGTRVIRTKPTKYINAGDRSGKLPEVMELDYAKIQEELKKS
jgi:hypothetical protein